jgi:uncharacterized protein YfbU (UPF0304 family)
MELTDVERIILIRQCSILQVLEQEDGQDKDFWDRAIEVLENGYTELYDKYLPHLEKPLPAGVYQFVADILNTYDAMDAFKANHPEDKDVASTFPGFSGNYESEYLALAIFFAKTQRWDHLMKDPTLLDSHAPMVPRYEKMISMWKSCGDQGQKLSREQVLALLNV